jgi:hypothetical protein
VNLMLENWKPTVLLAVVLGFPSIAWAAILLQS